jgi:hypothetical protein
MTTGAGRLRVQIQSGNRPFQSVLPNFLILRAILSEGLHSRPAMHYARPRF